MPVASDESTALIRSSLTHLGIERLVFAIHDSTFPGTPDEDIGRGSPYAKGAHELVGFLAGLGFDGVQFGPQGDTSLTNPSPYDGALFTKSPLSIALSTLREDEDWAPLCEGVERPGAALYRPMDRVQYAAAWHASRRALASLHDRFVQQSAAFPALHQRFADFRRREQAVLEADGDFEALVAEQGTDDWRQWRDDREGDLDQWLRSPPRDRVDAAARRLALVRTRQAAVIDRHLFGQFVLHEQHAFLRGVAARASAGGISLFGDLQIGFSHRDLWSQRALFRSDWLMGAPPSRTNPEGQPWGYPVLDPALYFAPAQSPSSVGASPRAPGPVLALLTARVDRMLADFDGIRIDHPHGLVCPWVYAAGDPDPASAVPRGARLFCSPHLPEHPQLSSLAIPDADQISHDPGIARYADDWVLALRPDQVERYGVLFDVIMARVAAAGRRQSDVVCEVLSTWPYPLRRVMNRYGLGRFCVTQKADLTRADDVYRSENASSRDWIMVGNHDTRPIWLLADAWHGSVAGAERALYLGERLMRDAATRPGLTRWIAADPRHLCQAMFADLFAGQARRVSVFCADLLGMREVYNRPGVVDPANWALRLPSDFADVYRQRLRTGEALNLPLALALAMSARATNPDSGQAAAVQRLLDYARALTPSLDETMIALVARQAAGGG